MAITLKGASAELECVHDDTKPTDVPVNTVITELDTGDKYYFDGEEWQKVGGASQAG